MEAQRQPLDPYRFLRFLEDYPQPARLAVGILVGSVLYEGVFFTIIGALPFIGLLSPSDYLHLVINWLPFLIIGFTIVYAFGRKYIVIRLICLLSIVSAYFVLPSFGYIFERLFMIPIAYLVVTSVTSLINSNTLHWFVVWFLVAIVAQGWLDANRSLNGASPYVLQLKEGQPARLVILLRALERGVLVRNPQLHQVQFFPWEAVEFISKPFAVTSEATPEI